MAEQAKKTVIDYGIEDAAKKRRRKLSFSPFGLLMWLVIPMWFGYYLKFQNGAWSNRLWRRNESILVFFVAVGIVIVSILSYDTGPFNVILSWIIFCVILNPLECTEKIGDQKRTVTLIPGISSRWLEPNPAILFEQKKRVTLSQATDISRGTFPLGITPGGWPAYWFARPKHLAIFGDEGQSFSGYGQQDLVNYLIMRAFEISPKTVVLVMDKDRAGLKLDFLQDRRGIVIYSDAVHAFKALRYVACIIQSRRDDAMKDDTHIVIVADWSIAQILLKKQESSLSEFVIDMIMQTGKYFNVTVVAVPPPRINFMILPAEVKDNLEPVQFFTTGTYPFEAGGKIIDKKVKSPRAGMDYFLWRMGEHMIELRGIYANKSQILNRIEKATQDFDIDRKIVLNYSPAVAFYVLILTVIKLAITFPVLLPIHVKNFFILLRHIGKRIRKKPAQLEFEEPFIKFRWPFARKLVSIGYPPEAQDIFDKFGACRFPEYEWMLANQEDIETPKKEVKINYNGTGKEHTPKPREFTVAG